LRDVGRRGQEREGRKGEKGGEIEKKSERDGAEIPPSAPFSL
jgi:hypothetical protein